MCGILALVEPAGPARTARIQLGLDALRHRGPDGAGDWEGARCALGHRRLATVDLAGGAQPIASEDGSIVCSVSGEFYGDAALRRDLEARGRRFRTKSDSELLVHLYREYGTDCVQHLRGEYAFVLWDETRQRLFAARDPFGVRPLLYARTATGWAFASEAKALFAAGKAPAWDRDALGLALSLQYAAPGTTLFEGVQELPPGGSCTVGNGKLVVSTSFAGLGVEAAEQGEEDAPGAVREALRSAVQDRLRGDVPVCTLLSGGLDSTAVAAFARESLGARLPAYTVRFRGGGVYDESGLAAESARALDLDHRVVDLSTDDLLGALPEAVAHGENLCVNHHVAAKFLLSRRIQGDGLRVALSGEGADEVFFGYAHLAADHGAGGADRGNAASAGLMLPDGEGLDLASVERVLGMTPTWLAAKASLGARVRTLLQEEVRRDIESRDPVGALARHYEAAPPSPSSAATRSAETWCRSALAGYILKTLGDGMELRHGVEGRLPFLDTNVIAAARRTSAERRLRGGVPKSLLRDALEGVVPDNVRTRQKHPFLAPAPAGPGYAAFLGGQLDLGAFAPAGLFDREAVRQTIQSLQGASAPVRTAWEPALMACMSAAWIGEAYGL